MASEREQNCGHRECHVHPGPQAKTAALEISAQAHDDDVEGGCMNRDCGDARRESHDEGNDYRDVTRRHLIPRDSHDGPFAPARPLRLGVLTEFPARPCFFRLYGRKSSVLRRESASVKSAGRMEHCRLRRGAIALHISTEMAHMGTWRRKCTNPLSIETKICRRYRR